MGSVSSAAALVTFSIQFWTRLGVLLCGRLRVRAGGLRLLRGLLRGGDARRPGKHRLRLGPAPHESIAF